MLIVEAASTSETFVLCTKLHGVTSRMTEILTLTAVESRLQVSLTYYRFILDAVSM
jgi:hypothetical protein